MNKVDLLGKIVSYNSDTNIISYKVNFITPEIHKEIENLIQYPHFIKQTFKTVKPFRSKTYKQQCQFWVDFSRVLEAQNIQRNSEIDDVFYKHIRETIFPARKIQIGYDKNNNPVFNYHAPNMKDLSLEEMMNVIKVFREKYNYLHINWEKIE